MRSKTTLNIAFEIPVGQSFIKTKREIELKINSVCIFLTFLGQKYTQVQNYI